MKYLILIILTVGCAKVNFTGNDPVSGQQSTSTPVEAAPPTSAQPPPAPTCTVAQTTENLRIIFMMDNSGSTLETDPSQVVRVKTLQNFLLKYSTKQNFSYAFAYFNDDPQFYDVANRKFTKQLPQSVFGASSDLTQALNLFTEVTPSGGTNYGAALQSVESMIANDPTTALKWNYVLVFMSDGQPTDLGGNVDLALRALVADIDTAAASHSALVTVSTVLFDPADDSQYATSKDYLSTMAQAGSGQFFDNNFPPPQGLEIDDIISVPGQNCSP